MKKRLEFLWELFLFLLGIKRKEKLQSQWKPSVTALIPAYNERECIALTIQSIKAQTYPVKEIIVVDDCSTDETGEIARKCGAKVVRTQKNTGTKARALNFGLDFVDGDLVLCVDADTILDPKALEILVSNIDEKTFAACCFVIPQRRKNFWELARLGQYFYYLSLQKSTQMHWNAVLVASGCASLINLKMLKELGKFPEGNMAEDMALTWKAHFAKKKIKFIPEALCYPKDPSNWKQYRAQVKRWHRGFLQCVSDYSPYLWKKPRLFIFVLYYLLSGIIHPFLTGTFFYLFLKSVWQQNFLISLAFGLFSVEILIVAFTILLAGVRYKLLREALFAIPLYWLVSPLDSYLFLRAVVEEWILKKRLNVWEKGH